jgi:phenylalanyl-tRNA synthetase beta chain
MPTVGISIARLRKLLRADVDDSRLEQLLDQLGCDVEGITTVRRYVSRHSDYSIELTPSENLPLSDPGSGVSGDKAEDIWQLAGEEQVVRLELLPVRPDIFDAGGLARALRGYLDVDVGLPKYRITEPGPLGEGEGKRWRVEVDAEIASSARPYIQCAVIRGLKIDEELLRAMMRLQEHLHWALCRDRKFASIGVYDLSTLSNPISYTLVDRDEFRFTPLFWSHRGSVSPASMLAEHPKGVGYAHLVEGQQRLAALVAANGNVLSLPPIINADETRVTTQTRDVLIDVTGSNLPVVTRALAIMATSLLELDTEGLAHLERVEIAYPDRTELTPALDTQQFTLNPQRAAALIGVELTREQVRELLLKMRHDVDSGAGVIGSGAGVPAREAMAGTEARPTAMTVTVGPFRNDIMHEVDLIEDVAIAYGYHHIKPTLVPSFTAGRTLALNDLSRRATTVLTGLGFVETQSLVLTSERDHYEKLRREVTPQRVTLANPISVDQTMLREHLYSGLLDLLSSNTDQPLPQRVFEVGDVVVYPEGAGPSARPESVAAASSSRTAAEMPPPHSESVDPEPTELRQIAGVICATRAGYADGRSVLDALLHELGYETQGGAGLRAGQDSEAGTESRPTISYTADDNPSALPGRAAALSDSSGARIGELFEVHPEVLELWRLENPVVAFSLTLGQVEYG